MRISKTALWLSVIDALLVLLASASGIFLKSIYAREPPFLVFSILTATAILVIFLVTERALCTRSERTEGRWSSQREEVTKMAVLILQKVQAEVKSHPEHAHRCHVAFL